MAFLECTKGCVQLIWTLCVKLLVCNTWRPVNTLRFVKSEEFPFNHACKEYLMLLVAFWDYEHTMSLAQDHGMQNQNNKTHWLLLITICHEYTLPKTKKRAGVHCLMCRLFWLYHYLNASAVIIWYRCFLQNLLLIEIKALTQAQ